jgi:SEC-C motif-containing protein
MSLTPLVSAYERRICHGRMREANTRPLAARTRGSLVTATAAVGRNDPCPCGSGRKHKRCCLGRYELDWVFLHEHPEILRRHWEAAWREGRV